MARNHVTPRPAPTITMATQCFRDPHLNLVAFSSSHITSFKLILTSIQDPQPSDSINLIARTMDAPRTLPQPDFALVGDSLRVVATHLDRCQNLPAVGGTARLETLMGQMVEEMRELRRDVNQQGETLRRVDQRLNRLETQVQTLYVPMTRSSLSYLTQ